MMERISPSQMAGMLLAFTLGSSIMFIPSPMVQAAGNSAWLSVLLAGVTALVQLACVLLLHKRHPKLDLVGYYRLYYKEWGAILLGGWLILVLMLMVANIVLGMSQFFNGTMMVDSTSYSLHLLVLTAAALTAFSGIEVASRMFLLFLFIPLAMVVVILIANTPLYEFEQLLPQFQDGLLPVAHGAYIAFGFPYAEIFVFAILMRYVRLAKGEPLGRYMFYALIVNMGAFIIVNLTAVVLFGPMAGTRKYMLYEMARIIDIPGILERIESIAGILLISGSYIKATIALIALNDTCASLFKLPRSRLLIMPLSVLIFFLSLNMFQTDVAAGEFWNSIWPLITGSCALPLVVTAAAELVSGRGKRGAEQGN